MRKSDRERLALGIAVFVCIVAVVLIAFSTFSQTDAATHVTPAPPMKVLGRGAKTVVWCFWDRGEAAMPELPRLCLQQLRQLNPDCDVRLVTWLDDPVPMEDGRQLVQQGYIRIQQYTDLLRLRLLSTFGGIWTDVTVWHTQPFREWLAPWMKNNTFFAPSLRSGDSGVGLLSNGIFQVAMWSMSMSSDAACESWLIACASPHDSVLDAWLREFEQLIEKHRARVDGLKLMDAEERLIPYFTIHEASALAIPSDALSDTPLSTHGRANMTSLLFGDSRNATPFYKLTTKMAESSMLSVVRREVSPHAGLFRGVL